LAVITENHLAAALIDRFDEIIDITIVSRNQNSIILRVESTVDFAQLEDRFRSALSNIIGNDIDPNSIHLTENQKRATITTTVTVTFDDDTVAAGAAINCFLGLLVLLCSLASFF